MPYIGSSPSNGVRRVHTYTATASQTTFTGASSEGVTLSYADTNYIDVFQNGVLLGSADYTSTSGTSVVLTQACSADDLIVIIVYDVFSVADTVSKTNGGSFDSAVTITTADNSVNLNLVSTDADANSGPLLEMKRDSSSPADNDLLGSITFKGENSASEEITYAKIQSKLKDATDGTEDGNISYEIMIDGTSRELLTVTKDSVVVNQDSQDVDFRVESDGDSNMFFIDGGNNIAHFKCNSQLLTSSEKVRINGRTSITNSDGSALLLNRDTSNGTLVFFMRGTTGVGSIGVTGSSTSFNTSSDYRLKENVVEMSNATSRLKQLKPYRFNFIADKDTTVDGFLAHEVSSIVPEAITGEKDAMTEEVLYVDGDEIPEGKKVGDVKEASKIAPQAIDQSKLVPLLVKTIQELEARITALENAE